MVACIRVFTAPWLNVAKEEEFQLLAELMICYDIITTRVGDGSCA